MSMHRASKGETEFYTSLSDLRTAFGLKEVSKQTRDVEKLEKQKDAFCKRHLCPACKHPMVYLGGNQMACANDSCRGVKHEMTTTDGEKKVWFTTAYDLLDDKGSEIASNIFS